VRTGIRSLVVSLVSVVVALVTVIAPAAKAAPAESWAQYQGNAAHTGVDPLEHTLNVSGLTLSWVGRVPGNLDWTSPVITGGNVYIAGGDAGLVVFPQAGCGASTCDPSWLGQTGPQAEATPAVADGLVYLTSQTSRHSNHGRLNVFDATGCGAAVCQPLWQGIGPDQSFGVTSPAVSDGVVYVGSYDGNIYAFDASGCGRPKCPALWSGHVGEHVNSSPAVANGVVYAGSGIGHATFAAFDAAGCGAKACDPLWTAPLGKGSDIGSPSVAGGKVFVTDGRFLNAFDASGCGAAVCLPLWKGPAKITGNTPAVYRGVVYVDAQPFRDHFTSLGVVEAFDADGCGQDRCKPLWTGINFSNAPESSPVIANGVVYIGKGPASGFPVDSGVFSYAAAGCGKKVCPPLGFAQTGEQQFYLASSPAVVDGHVYMGSTDTPTNQAGLYVWSLPEG
jgi:outer membrane protein assembly factor BamB